MCEEQGFRIIFKKIQSSSRSCIFCYAFPLVRFFLSYYYYSARCHHRHQHTTSLVRRVIAFRLRVPVAFPLVSYCWYNYLFIIIKEVKKAEEEAEAEA
jgi:hypothetical protein